MGHGNNTLFAENRQRLKELIRGTQTKSDYRRVLCVWLQLALSLTNEQIAVGLGISEGTVRRIQLEFRKHGDAVLLRTGAGGPHHRYLSHDEEQNLVAKYRKRTRYGAAFNMKAFKEEFERRVGKRVATSTVYRLLKRHGCQKLLPRVRSGRKTKQ